MVGSKFCKWWKSTAQPRGLGRSLSGSKPRALIRARPRSGKECLPTAGLQHFLQGRAVISPASWRRSARGWRMLRWVMRSLDSPTTDQAKPSSCSSSPATSCRVLANVSWEQAGALFVAGTTAYAAVRSVALSAGDTVVVSGAAGGVGSIAVQLARNAGAKVIGLSSDANHKWLADHGVIPVTYGDGVEDRIRAASGGKVDAFVDTFGGGYVELALKLGVAPNRIDTIIDFAAAAKYGVKTEGNHEAATADVLAQLAGLLAAGRLEIPIAKVYPLAEVRDAYRELEQRHTRGKIVLEP